MSKRSKQVSRKRKLPPQEDGDKQNESILEDIDCINTKNAETALEKKGAPLENKEDPLENKEDPLENKEAHLENKEAPPENKEDPGRKKRPERPLSKSQQTSKKESTKPTRKPPVMPPVSPKQKKPSDEEKEAVAAEKEVANENKTVGKGEPVPNLPDGWRREKVVRKSGKTAGQIDIYFYSPDGVKLRSRPDVVSYLSKRKSNIKMEEFDFSKRLKVADAVAKKKANENSTTPKKKSKPGKNDKKLDEPKESTKAAKKSRSSEKSAKVPPPPDDDAEEKNDADGKPNAVLVKVVNEPKRKRPRK